MCKAMTVCAAAALLAASAAGGEAAFAKKPVAVRDGGGVRISFAVSAPTDAEVSVLSAEGKVVRRLAAGLLGGEKPPPPFGPGLAQEIVWDGRDDAGRAAGGEPFRVRVALGLGVKSDGGAFGSELRPDTLIGVTGLACAPDGRVYTMCDRWNQIWWRATSIHAFRRSGEYERTVKPFPAGLPRERLSALTALADEAGRPVPVIYRVLAMSYYPNEDLTQHMTVAPDGNLHFMVRRAGYHGQSRDHGNDRFLASLAPDGAPAYAEYAGPVIESELSWGDLHLASSSDGKAVFVTGYHRGPGAEGQGSADRPNAPAVWKIGLPERKEARVFFGDPAKPGAGDGNLNDPRGLAVDGKGRLFLADRGNDRILILSEEDAKPLGSIPAKAPVWVGVHRRTGAVYAAGSDALVKFVAGEGGRYEEKSRLAYPPADPKERGRVRRSFALDAEAEPAVLWLGRNRGGDPLLRVEDRGEGFADAARAGFGPERSHYWNMSSCPDRRLVSCKVGPTTLRVLDEETGKTRDLRLAGDSGQTYRLGPDGRIYGMDHWKWGIRRWDRDGKPLPFEATKDLADGGRGRTPSQASGTTAWERDFEVDRAGNVYVKQRGKFYHGRMRVDKYDADGRFVKTLVWALSDGALGPRLDPAGNIYIAECVKPQGEPYPEFFKGRLPATAIDKKGDVEQQYRWMYGSVLKFGPAGGAVWFPVLEDSYAYAFDGEPQLPAGQARMKVDTVSGDRMKVSPGEVQGAEWMRFGCSYLLDMHPSHNRRCHCTATEFEVDDYGRSYCTDQGRFRIAILDTAGNEILAFGRYGNQDSVGPEIAFNWFGGLAVTDRWIYVADIGNRRALRIRKTYAAEETCEVPPGEGPVRPGP